jgi:hypothetical protein
MRNKFLLGAAIAGAVLFNQANACSIAQWSATDSVGVVAADAGEPTQPSTSTLFRRYSARCALKTTGAATAKYVQDNSPASATTYKARFYLYSGDGSANAVDTGAAGFVYLARDGAGANLIKLALAGGNLQTTVANATGVTNIPITPQRWYSVEIDWQQAAGAAGFVIKVQGAGSTTPVTQTVATTASTAVLANVRLGLSAGSTGTAFFDEYDSRRTTAPGRLCRGDVNGDRAINIFDRGGINAEIGTGNPAPGQPDCTEDGSINVFDRGCVNAQIAANPTCAL